MKPPSTNNAHYNKHLSSNARKLRSNITKAEACLWKYVLKAEGMKGFTFRRQRPILQYIADFLCKELFLIIEVDGITHSYEEFVENDMNRQRALENAGFTDLRFTDEEVLNHINSVRLNIESEVTRLIKQKDISPPVRNRKKN